MVLLTRLEQVTLIETFTLSWKLTSSSLFTVLKFPVIRHQCAPLNFVSGAITINWHKIYNNIVQQWNCREAAEKKHRLMHRERSHIERRDGKLIHEELFGENYSFVVRMGRLIIDFSNWNRIYLTHKQRIDMFWFVAVHSFRRDGELSEAANLWYLALGVKWSTVCLSSD